MRKVFLVTIYLLGTSHASAQFALNVSQADIRKQQGRMALEDLAIDETGLVVYGQLCNADGYLFISKETILANEKSAYSLNLRVQRKQGAKVVIEAVPGEKTDPLRKDILGLLYTAGQVSCDRMALPAERRFEVTSINGMTSSKDLVAK